MSSVSSWDSSIELYDSLENEVIVRFRNGLNGKAEFSVNYAWLVEEFKDRGIRIPEAATQAFHAQRIIVLDSEDFGRAFHDFYCPENYMPSRFHWRNLGEQ